MTHFEEMIKLLHEAQDMQKSPRQVEGFKDTLAKANFEFNQHIEELKQKGIICQTDGITGKPVNAK